MTATNIIVLIAVVIVSLAIGLFFGLIPLKTERMTDGQNRYQQILGFAGVGLIVILIVAGQDAASWAAILVMIAGVLIAKIPALHSRALERFPFFRPKPEPQRRPRKKTKRRK